MRTRTAAAYGFLTPYLLVFAAFWIWPILYSFYLSFLATRACPGASAPQVTWGRLFVDPAFLNALKNTLVILVIQVPVMIALATVLAVLLNSHAAARPRPDALRLLRAGGGGRGRLCRGVPADVQPRLRHRQQAARHRRPAGRCSWFANPTAAMALIIMAVTWRWVGYNAIIILSGPAVDPRGRLRGGDPRPGLAAAAVPLHHPAAPAPGDPVLRRPLGDRHDAALRRAVPDHQPRRPRRRHRDARALPLPAGLHRAELRLRLGGRLHHRGARGADLARSTSGSGGSAHEVEVLGPALALASRSTRCWCRWRSSGSSRSG